MKIFRPSLLVLPLLASGLVLTGCERMEGGGGGSGTGSNSSDAAAYAEWEAQQKHVRQQMADYDRQSRRVDDQQELNEKQMIRLDKIADKQEEQLKRGGQDSRQVGGAGLEKGRHPGQDGAGTWAEEVERRDYSVLRI